MVGRQVAFAAVARTVRGFNRPTIAPMCHRPVTCGRSPQLVPCAGPLNGPVFPGCHQHSRAGRRHALKPRTYCGLDRTSARGARNHCGLSRRQAVVLPYGPRLSHSAITAMQLAPAYSLGGLRRIRVHAPRGCPAEECVPVYSRLPQPFRVCTVDVQGFTRFSHPVRPASAVGVRCRKPAPEGAGRLAAQRRHSRRIGRRRCEPVGEHQEAPCSAAKARASCRCASLGCRTRPLSTRPFR